MTHTRGTGLRCISDISPTVMCFRPARGETSGSTACTPAWPKRMPVQFCCLGHLTQTTESGHESGVVTNSRICPIAQTKALVGRKKLLQCTRRESDVLVLLAHGLSNKAIALRLGLSPHTVRDHVCCLMQRHDLSNRVELAVLAHTRPWQIGDAARQCRLTKQPVANASSEEICGGGWISI